MSPADPLRRSAARAAVCLAAAASLAALRWAAAATPGAGAPAPAPSGLLARMIEGPLADVAEIVFAERVGGTDHWYANFGYYSAPVAEYPPQRAAPDQTAPPIFKEGGGRLCAWDLRAKRLRVLLDDPAGSIRDPQVHPDGRSIVFSWRRNGSTAFHLYEIQADATGLRQITDGPWDDIEPAWLPDGGIVFCSSRCMRYVNCWRTPVAVLYRCERDGGRLRALSTNIEHDNTPWPLPDGRILYMRWEYVDRNQLAYHHLWTTHPDGSRQMVFFGNQFRDTAMLDAKPIPGSRRVVASFSPGHGRPEHMGHVTIVDPGKGPDDLPSARRVSRDNRLYRDPYALSEDCILVADEAGLHVMDGDGRAELVYAPPAGPRGCHEPRPLRARPPEATIASVIVPAASVGRLVLSDVYAGRNMAGVARGEIRALLVFEQLPKPVNFSGGMWPISDGGTFTLARLLGRVEVAADGSADFEAPAMRSLFFVAVDEREMSVKRMQSFVSVQPGEVTGCVGCHEPRTETPPAAREAALRLGRAPRRVEPIPGMPDVFDYHRDIQPILDRHCVGCHNPRRMEGRVDLSGDHTPIFAQGYYTLVRRRLVSDGRNEVAGNLPPRSIGSSASPLLERLDGRHHGARPTDAERRRIRLWIEAGANYAGTYAALGSGMHPVEFPLDAMERRCGACHGREPPKAGRIGEGRYFRFGTNGPALPLVHQFTDLASIRGRIGYFKSGDSLPPQALCNLTHPELSLLLRAPLSPDAGGLGWCGAPVFAGTNDADYVALLGRIEEAARRHAREKRFDMPGFRPNDWYIRAMQRYGVLPPDLPADAPVDGYEADRAYWARVIGAGRSGAETAAR